MTLTLLKQCEKYQIKRQKYAETPHMYLKWVRGGVNNVNPCNCEQFTLVRDEFAQKYTQRPPRTYGPARAKHIPFHGGLLRAHLGSQL